MKTLIVGLVAGSMLAVNADQLKGLPDGSQGLAHMSESSRQGSDLNITSTEEGFDAAGRPCSVVALSDGFRYREHTESPEALHRAIIARSPYLKSALHVPEVREWSEERLAKLARVFELVAPVTDLEADWRKTTPGNADVMDLVRVQFHSPFAPVLRDVFGGRNRALTPEDKLLFKRITKAAGAEVLNVLIRDADSVQ